MMRLRFFDFRVTPNPNFMLDVNLDVEFDNKSIIKTRFDSLLCRALRRMLSLFLLNLVI